MHMLSVRAKTKYTLGLSLSLKSDWSIGMLLIQEHTTCWNHSHLWGKIILNHFPSVQWNDFDLMWLVANEWRKLRIVTNRVDRSCATYSMEKPRNKKTGWRDVFFQTTVVMQQCVQHAVRTGVLLLFWAVELSLTSLIGKLLGRVDEGVRANVNVSNTLKMSFTRCHTL